MSVEEFNANERAKLVSILIEEVGKGSSLKAAFKVAAIQLNSKDTKCKNQWYNRLHFKYGEKLEEARKKFQNQTKQISSISNVVKATKYTRPNSWPTKEEEKLVSLALPLEGNRYKGKWRDIAKNFPKRTTKACENHWYQIRHLYIKTDDNLNVENTPKVEQPVQMVMETTLDFKSIISQLGSILHKAEKDLQDANTANKNLLAQNQYLHDENKRLLKGREGTNELQAQCKTLQDQLMLSQKNYAQLKADHDAVLRVFDLARKSVVTEEAGEHEKPVFKMDQNGNLERTKH